MKYGIWILCALLVAPLGAASAQRREPYRSPPAAAAKSIVFPGWGQFSNGDDKKGTVAVAAALAGLAMGTSSIEIWHGERGADFNRNLGWSVYALTLALGAVDAYRVADRINRENGYELARIRILDDGRERQLGIALLQFSFGGP